MQQTDIRIGASERFAVERARLLAGLGALTEGGVVEGIAHIGGTSVSNLRSRPCVDIGLAIWPFPLDDRRRTMLGALGYEPAAGYEVGPEQRFLHLSGTIQLFLVEAGSERWTDYRILREYLSHNIEARRDYSLRKEEWADCVGMIPPSQETSRAQLFAETLEAARLWSIAHYGVLPVQAVVQELESLSCPWYIAGGWALDLFLGRVTRVHHDVDVVVAREDQLELQGYMNGRGWKWVTPLDGHLGPWPPHMCLELPRHQAHAHRAGDFIDFPLGEIQNGVWRFRRNLSVVRTLDRMALRTEAGIPFLSPEIVLLFKSRNSDTCRVKDKEDFAKVHGCLEAERRAWLRWALTVIDPEHPWIGLLT